MTEPASAPHPVLPYVVPMFGFLALTSLEGHLSGTGSGPASLGYPLAYTLKVALVTPLAWACRSSWRDLAPWPGVRSLAPAAAVGLLVAVLWVGLDGLYPTLGFLGTRAGFDPNVLKGPARWGFVAVRFVGLVALVPLIEELFWRSFLIRWLVDPEFTKVPIGRVTPTAALVTSALFAAAHPEWLPALITGLAWAWLLGQTRSVSACLVSHASANLALGLYVITTGDWKYW